MNVLHRWGVLLTTLALLLAGASVSGQGDGIAFGQPVLAALDGPGETVTFTYTAAATQSVTFQAISDSAPPVLRLTGDGFTAGEANTAAALTVNFTTLVTPGTYTLTVSAVGNTTGTLIITVQTETPVSVQALTVGLPTTVTLTSAAPIALFTFTGLAEAVQLAIDSLLTDTPPSVLPMITVAEVNGQTRPIAELNSDWLLDVRLSFQPAPEAQYLVTLVYADQRSTPQPVTLCLSTANADCGTPIEPLPAGAACLLTPAQAGGVNIRQTADVAAPILRALPGGQSASVIGVSPNGAFFNVSFAGAVGWAAASASVVSGDCAALPVLQPPILSVPPTAAPSAPTVPPAPPTAVPSPTPSGPCLITMTGEALVYTQPNAIPDHIQDEVQPGYQLIPVGRLADGLWWRTNYFNAWIQTSLFGSVANVTGNCGGLPIVSP